MAKNIIVIDYRTKRLSCLGSLCEFGSFSPRVKPAPVSRDPDDDAVLALAIAAQAELIVSGDDDLLSLGAHAGIQITDAANALTKIIG